MPQRRASRNSTVIRLPKGERSHPTSKVNVVSQKSLNRTELNDLSPSSDTIAASPTSTSTSSSTCSHLSSELRVSALPYDVWRKILWHARADLQTVFTCMRVSAVFRRAASEVLSEIKSVDLSRIFRRRFNTQSSHDRDDSSSCYVPTERQVVHIVQKLPNLQDLSITRWPYIAPFPHVTHVLLSTFASTALQSATFSYVPVPPNMLINWLEMCPNLNILRLASNSSVNDELCTKLVSAHRNSRLPLRRLQLLALSDSRTISDKGIETVLRSGLCSHFIGTSLFSVRSVSVAPTAYSTNGIRTIPRMSTLQLNACPALRSLLFRDVTIVPQELILTHCPAFTKLHFTGTLSQDQTLPIERFVATGCPRLSNLAIPTLNATCFPFRQLRELNLFGARRLQPQNVQTMLGLDHADGPCLPSLEVLNMNGTSIEKVVLQSYSNLTEVDISGSCVRELTIMQCWALRKLVILGKKMPLTRVSISVSSNCDVIGARREWQQERFGDGPTSFLSYEHVSG